MSEQIIELPFDVPLLPVKRLKAGSISCLYEKGNLRYIRFRDAEVVRMIYTAVRNANWETAPYEIEDERIRINERSFFISYTAIYQLNDIRYKSCVTIKGKEDNSISFVMKGEALSTFEKNRVGLCVHHSIKECAGKEVTIIKPGNSSYAAVFPEYISPHQPFKEVCKMEWEINKECEAQLVFEGDVFETEDQRNWTDNSYKTYSTPLELPSPVRVFEGETMEQRIELKIIKSENPIHRITGDKFESKEEKVPFPKIGYCRPNGSKALTTNEISALQKIPFNHYRVTLSLSCPKWKEELMLAASEAEELGTSLELILVFTDSFAMEVESLIDKLVTLKVNIKSILPLHTAYKTTPAFLIQQIYPPIKNAFPGIKIGYGTDAFFAELNRSQPVGFEFDFVSFSMYPQVHATDTRTIIENLESHQHIIKTIQQFTSKPIHISPITFQERPNLHYTKNEDDNELNEGDADARLHTFFGASWTLLCLKNFCKTGHLTFYQTTGKKGLVNNMKNGTEEFSPLYNLLVQLKTFNPLYIITGRDENDKGKIRLENKDGDLLNYMIDTMFVNVSECSFF